LYGFVDTIAEIGMKKPLLSLNTIFNGVNLDEALSDQNGGFTTLSVRGRGILTRRIITKEIAGCHGLREKSFTYDAREITVKYRLNDRTSSGFREQEKT
jgi:hypothetical protein